MPAPIDIPVFYFTPYSYHYGDNLWQYNASLNIFVSGNKAAPYDGLMDCGGVERLGALRIFNGGSPGTIFNNDLGSTIGFGTV